LRASTLGFLRELKIPNFIEALDIFDCPINIAARCVLEFSGDKPPRQPYNQESNCHKYKACDAPNERIRRNNFVYERNQADNNDAADKRNSQCAIQYRTEFIPYPSSVFLSFTRCWLCRRRNDTRLGGIGLARPRVVKRLDDQRHERLSHPLRAAAIEKGAAEFNVPAKLLMARSGDDPPQGQNHPW
jgi:hypothetical protein